MTDYPKIPPIQRLSPQVANQIAAGEVVERPASVVKELLENSLDAAATALEIEVEQGGVSLIRVRDNGWGIRHDELVLALNRHTTNKIKSLDDLNAIHTLGFRGEALASIASIARLTLNSRFHEAEHGYAVRFAEDGQSPVVEPVAHPVGTTLDVRDLFYNVPARRKFLRTEKTEFGHIHEIIKRLALSRFTTHFKLIHNHKTVLALKPAVETAEQLQRVAMLCGPDFVEYMLTVNETHGGLTISGWITKPAYPRTQPDTQYFFVNGRMVRDKLLNHALRQAYDDVLYTQRQPAFILYLHVDTTEVDVNVHPSKSEVRFAQGSQIHDFLVRAIKNVLATTRPQTLPANYATSPQNFAPKPTYTSVHETMNLYNVLSASEPKENDLLPPVGQGIHTNVEEKMPPATATESLVTLPPLGYALAQLHGMYILAENAEGLVVVDIHAAHERILYEQLKLANSVETAKTQLLLVPFTIPVSEPEADLAEQFASVFTQFGIEICRGGVDVLLIRQIPLLLAQTDMTLLIREVLADLKCLEVSSRLEAQVNAILGTVACHAATRTPCHLNLQEMNALLREMEKTARSNQCNHGRPTWIQLNKYDLNKWFLRSC